MRLRSKGLFLLAFAPLLSLWVYALSQSFGEVSSLMDQVPEQQTVRQTAAPSTAPVRTESRVTLPASREAAEEEFVEPAPAALSPNPSFEEEASVVAANYGQVYSDDDYSSEEFPYQRSFDPYVYEQVRQEHFENLPQWRMPPEDPNAPAVEQNVDSPDLPDPRLRAAFED